ncbi:MAG: MMPL family transporter [Myxococcota bacterium]
MALPEDAQSGLRRRIEAGLEAWASFVARHPLQVIGLSLALVVGLLPQARHIQLDTHPEKFLAQDHPVRAAYADFKDRFGGDNLVLVTLEADDWFTLDRLAWLRDLHDALEAELPHVEEITSLVNARVTRGEGDSLIVEDLLERWPEGESDLARLRTIVRETPVHQRLLLGEGERHTSLVIELVPWIRDAAGDDLLGGFEDHTAAASEGVRAERRGLSQADEASILAALDRVLARFARPDVEVGVSGMPSVNVGIIESMDRDMRRFVSASIVAIVLVLFVLLRRVSGVVLPLVVVVMALLATVGWMGTRGAPVNMTVQILPTFLLAVGASAAIHLLVIFFHAYDAGASRAEAVRVALGHAGLPITMACLTTAAGLASFLASDLMIVRDIGVIAPVGIAFALAFVLALLPALLVLCPISRRPPDAEGARGRIVQAVVVGADWSVRHPLTVVLLTALVAAVALVGARNIVFDTDPMDNVEPGSPLIASMAVSDALMAGTTALELVIDSGEVNGFHDPARQQALADLATWVDAYDDEGVPFVRKTMSLNDVLKEIHQALNENRPEFHTTPTDRALIAQELLLFENSGSDDLEDLVDSEFRMARLTVRSVWESALFLEPRMAAIVDEARLRFPEARIVATGIVAIVVQAMLETQRGMASSYAIALLTITPMMMVLVGTLRGGLSSMVPNLLPVLIVLGIFGYSGVPLAMFSTMTGSIAIGLAVDDTIHFFHSFYREFARTGDTRASVRRTLESTGRALLTTSIVLSIGFSVFLFSPIGPVRTFGGVTTLAIAIAFLADVLIAPALVTLATRGRQATGVPPIR